MNAKQFAILLIVLAGGCQSARYSAEADIRYEVRQDDGVLVACGKVIVTR